MAQPIRRNAGAVRAYSDNLRVLMSQLAADPLDEQKSIALVSHIVERRADAAQLLDDLQAPRVRDLMLRRPLQRFLDSLFLRVSGGDTHSRRRTADARNRIVPGVHHGQLHPADRGGRRPGDEPPAARR